MSVVLVGIVMMVTPGPAVIVIPLGLAILATEFVWARRILEHAKRRIQEQSAVPRSGRNRFWPIFVLLIIVPTALYALSFGPACWLTHGRENKWMRAYWPFGWAAIHAPRVCSDSIVWYGRLGLKENEPLHLPAAPNGAVRSVILGTVPAGD
jgi:hypothetical protein